MVDSACRPLFDDVLQAQWNAGELDADGKSLEGQISIFALSRGMDDQFQTYKLSRLNGAIIKLKSIPLTSRGID